MNSSKLPILSVKRLSIRQADNHQVILDQVSLDIHPGEMLALVGESGSGKSMTASAVIGLIPAALEVSEGELLFQGEDLLRKNGKQRRKLAGKRIGYVFQDYRGSFAPFKTIGKQLMDAIRAHHAYSRKECKKIVLESLEKVALPAERIFSSYSFQLSGGQLQRAALSAVFMLKPELLIADEPTTALDVVSGETVLDLMRDIQKETGCAILLISHDLQLILKRADRVAVMKEGQIIEMKAARDMSRHAEHPYTLKLLDSCPELPGKHGNHLHRHEHDESHGESHQDPSHQGHSHAHNQDRELVKQHG